MFREFIGLLLLPVPALTLAGANAESTTAHSAVLKGIAEQMVYTF